MTSLIPIVLFGWVVVAVGLFLLLPPRRAAITSYIAAWLFLPQAGIEISGLPDLTKVTAAGLGALLGAIIFDAGRLAAFRFSWPDLPMVVWCLSSLPASVTNDLSWYDGVSGVLSDTLTWGIPYFLGRVYFTDLQGLRELAIGIFLGGLVYVPLCLIEIRLSPQLHNFVYGYHPSSFAMTSRLGGWRPTVFMQHGLMVGMWMTSATLVGAWLWSTGALRGIRSAPMWLLVGSLAVTTVLCKSTGALGLLVLGLGVLFANRFTRSSILLAIIVLIAPLYMTARVQGWWSGQQLVDIAMKVDEERAASLETRITNENLILEKASHKPLFGWGGWGRWRVYDEYTGEDLTVSDGMWVIARGEKGLVGLISNTLLVLLPFALLLRRVPARLWSAPVFAAPAALAVLLVLWSLDNLLNAMINPVYILAAGGLTGFCLAYPAHIAAMRQVRRRYIALMHQHQVRLVQQASRRQRLAQHQLEQSPPRPAGEQ